MPLRPALCELIQTKIVQPRRTAGLTGQNAAVSAGGGGRVWAGLVGRFEIAWLDRGDTTNGSYEPNETDAARSMDVRCCETAQNLQQLHGF